MSDTNKLIAELREHNAKASPVPWETAWLDERDVVIKTPTHIVCSANGIHEDDVGIIVAMRNALPELLDKAQIGSEPCSDCEDLQGRADDAEEFVSDMIKVLRKHFPGVESDENEEYSLRDFDEAIGEEIASLKERAVEAERQLERMVTAAERYAPCPFVLFPDYARRIFKEACRTCSPAKDLRLACLREYAAQKESDA